MDNFNRTNRNILDIERCEREKDGFVTVFLFSALLFGIIHIKICFSVQIEIYTTKVFKTFFQVNGKFVAILFFCFIFF